MKPVPRLFLCRLHRSHKNRFLEGSPPAASRRRSSGFTLIELLVVITIIAVLAALSFVGLAKMRAAADRSTVVSNMRQIGTGMASFLSERGKYPGRTDPEFDRCLFPYLGYDGELPDGQSIPIQGHSDFEQTAALFAMKADTEKRPEGVFKRSFSIVPWTTNWSNGTAFRGWKDLPYNQGVPMAVVTRPERSAVLVEGIHGTKDTANLLGGGNWSFKDMGGPITMQKGKQYVLFADGRVESMSSTMRNEEFVQKYWPGSIGNSN